MVVILSPNYERFFIRFVWTLRYIFQLQSDTYNIIVLSPFMLYFNYFDVKMYKDGIVYVFVGLFLYQPGCMKIQFDG